MKDLFMICKICKRNPSTCNGICHICEIKQQRGSERQIQPSENQGQDIIARGVKNNGKKL